MDKAAYTIPEIARLTGFSPQTVSRIFEKEPGVLVRSNPERMHKRRYRVLRIPREVFERVRLRMAVK